MPRDDSGLTPKQAAFVAEYLIDLNSTQAAIRAGYSPKTAKEQASRLLTNVNVSLAVAKAKEKRSERVEVTQDYVIANLMEVVERCMQRAPVMVRQGKEMVQLKDDDDNDVWQFDARGAVGSLGLLGRHLAMFTDKQLHSADEGLALLLAKVRAK